MITEETRKKLDGLKFPITTKDLVKLTGKTNQQIGKTITFLGLPCKRNRGSLQITRSEAETLIEHFAAKASKASKDMMNKIQQIQENAIKKEEDTMTVRYDFMTLADIAKQNGVSEERTKEVLEALNIKPSLYPDEDTPLPLYKGKMCGRVERFLIEAAEEELLKKEAEEKAAEEERKRIEAEKAAEKAKEEAKKQAAKKAEEDRRKKINQEEFEQKVLDGIKNRTKNDLQANNPDALQIPDYWKSEEDVVTTPPVSLEAKDQVSAILLLTEVVSKFLPLLERLTFAVERNAQDMSCLPDYFYMAHSKEIGNSVRKSAYQQMMREQEEK